MFVIEIFIKFVMYFILLQNIQTHFKLMVAKNMISVGNILKVGISYTFHVSCPKHVRTRHLKQPQTIFRNNNIESNNVSFPS